MRKYAAYVLAWVCVLCLVGCGQKEDLKQGDYAMQYFFCAKVVEVHEEYLMLEVFDTGNTRLSEGATVEVSTDVTSVYDCPGFVDDEFARVIMERNTDDNPPDRLEALFIYKIDETGKGIADTDVPFPLDGVTMEVTEYSDTSVTVKITNDTDMNIRCGEDFRLKILDGETDEWRDLDTVIDDYGFFEEAYIIQKDSPYEMVIDFEWLYGKLEPGRYQIVKTVMDFRGTGDYTNYVFAAEFDISMEVREHSVAETSETTQPDISVASFWDREGAVLLSAEDAAVIAGLVESGTWMEGTGDCANDCIIFMDGEKINYHSDCGTLNDAINEKRLHLTEEQQAAVNAILEKYISLEQGLTTSPDMEEKPAQSAGSSSTPQDGTIQDGKIYILGFGWVDYEGGGTEGIYAEDMYENGNTIGIMD